MANQRGNFALNDGESINCEGSVSTLISRNITVLRRRTSIRLEPEMWSALRDISKRECCSIHDICTVVYMRKDKNTSLTAAIRVFLLLYFKAASTEEGHNLAGHGNFNTMIKRARVNDDNSAFFGKKNKCLGSYA
ncbi:MAG: ribbon-helix-helix domain-containing protein [Alphaproteobacteria bacterium]|nr:ribbon-helix-helix domain-containing protein [Alphaproteobacteria bacterium]